MSFGSRQLDEAFDKYITQTPEEYFGWRDTDCGNDKHELCEDCKLCHTCDKVNDGDCKV